MVPFVCKLKMIFVNLIIILLFNTVTLISSDIHDGSDKVDNSVIRMNLNYKGEKFPIRYLVPDNTLPTIFDLNRYLNHLQRSLKYFSRYPNKTDCNTAVCVFFTKSILKRTLLDDRNKLQSSHINLISEVINDAENILSHYTYLLNTFYDWTDTEYRLSKLFQNDEIIVHNIGKFNRNGFETWLLSNEYMNDFIEEIDEGTLPKEKYAELCEKVEPLSDYFISVEDSDKCISRVAYNREPRDVTTTQPCIADDYCALRITSSPSVAYSLSHRLLNIFFRLKVRKCYIMSEEEDLKQIDKLCSFMYRETVYLARRGYFARDLFLEHITLCAMMGYVEFHRVHWFNKALSWMNDYDCVKEYRNFEINQTKLTRDSTDSNHIPKSEFVKWQCGVVCSVCDNHPSALLMSVLSHAVRYATHFMKL